MLLDAFSCHFEAMYDQRIDDAASCSVAGRVAFSPSGEPNRLIRGALAQATDRVYLNDVMDRIETELDKGWDGTPVPGLSAERLQQINTPTWRRR